MPAIPFEILTLTFKKLTLNDLAQCQLVCKSWNQASLKILYSNIIICSENVCKLYVRTINSSPHLGKYLEVIEAYIRYYNDEDEANYDLSEDEEEGRLNPWNRHDLLNTVMNHCPNVLKILNESPSLSFLTRLTNAGLQGLLPRLQYVSCSPELKHFYNYINTMLVFKKTLTTLELPNSATQNLFEAEALPSLFKNLNQFPCLRTLEMSSYSKLWLSHYDTIIDSCKNLTTFIIHPKSFVEKPIPTNHIEAFQPHYKIETLECTWNIINAEEEILYIMRKFPNLKSLTINRERDDDRFDIRCSVSTLKRLLRYVMTLKKGVISMPLNPEDLINTLVSIVNEKIGTIDISISICNFPAYYQNRRKVSTCFTGKSLTLEFYSPTDSYIKLLSEIGNKVRSLFLEIPTELQNSVENIKIVELCPSLQDLVVKLR